MKTTFVYFLSLILFYNCNEQHKSTDTNVAAEAESSIAKRIADAHGYENWNAVTKVYFTFNVDTENNHFERQWQWEPKTQQVTLITAQDTLTYNRKNIDSTTMNADRAFINDKFWCFVPFQLVWDEKASVSEVVKTQAPISQKDLNKVTLSYENDNGGYTPGDAYDLYFDENYRIKEWVYRKSNAETPSLTNTFEDYQTFNGITIATSHKRPNANWNLNFTDIKIIRK